jgi:hypothetical protein
MPQTKIRSIKSPNNEVQGITPALRESANTLISTISIRDLFIEAAYDGNAHILLTNSTDVKDAIKKASRTILNTSTETQRVLCNVLGVTSVPFNITTFTLTDPGTDAKKHWAEAGNQDSQIDGDTIITRNRDSITLIQDNYEKLKDVVKSNATIPPKGARDAAKELQNGFEECLAMARTHNAYEVMYRAYKNKISTTEIGGYRTAIINEALGLRSADMPIFFTVGVPETPDETGLGVLFDFATASNALKNYNTDPTKADPILKNVPLLDVVSATKLAKFNRVYGWITTKSHKARIEDIHNVSKEFANSARVSSVGYDPSVRNHNAMQH